MVAHTVLSIFHYQIFSFNIYTDDLLTSINYILIQTGLFSYIVLQALSLLVLNRSIITDCGFTDLHS